MIKLRPSLALLIFGSLVALACGDSNDDDDKGASNTTNTPGAMGGTGSPGGSSTNPSATNRDAGPLGGIGALFGDGGFDPSTFDPNTICTMNPEYCKDGSVDIQGGIDMIATQACMFNAALCVDSGAGFIGGLAGGLGGLFGGAGVDAGAGGTGAQSDAGSAQSGSDAGTASDSGGSGDAH